MKSDFTTCQWGIIVQARMNSTRLPGKMAKQFHNGLTMFEIVLIRLQQFFPNIEMIVATSVAPEDDKIASMAGGLGVPVFRGSESDVLSRFIGCAHSFKFDVILRVCADNPFIYPPYMAALIEEYTIGTEYVSFRTPEGVPTIRTHYGLFTELVATKALEKAFNSTKEKKFQEHVTNYIYENPNQFQIQWLSMPSAVLQLPTFRLTIDTKEDFELAADVYRTLKPDQEQFYDIASLFELLRSDTKMIDAMQAQIISNTK